MWKVFYVSMIIITVFTVVPLFLTPLPPGPGIEDFSPSRMVASASLGLKFVWVAGGLVSIGICIIWGRFSNSRKRRTLAATIPGVILFMFSSLFVGLFTASRIVIPPVLKARGELWLGQIRPIGIVINLVAGCLMLVGSYFLCFRKKETGPSQDAVGE